MSKKYVVRLAGEGRAGLQRLVGAGNAAARKILHAHVLLQANQEPHGPGWPHSRICRALSVHPNTVAGIRQRLSGAYPRTPNLIRVKNPSVALRGRIYAELRCQE